MATAVATRFHPNEKDSAIVNDKLQEYLQKTERFRRNLAQPAAAATEQCATCGLYRLQHAPAPGACRHDT